MSFQGKKSIPRITVSPAPGPTLPHAPCPPPGVNRPGSAPSALPYGSSPRTCFCPGAGPSRRVPCRAAGGRGFRERLPDPFPEPDAQVPGHASVPGPLLRPGRARGRERPAPQSTEVPRSPRRTGAEAGELGFGALPGGRPADGAFCWHRRPGLGARMLFPAWSDWLAPDRASAVLGALCPRQSDSSPAETPGEASAHWSLLSGHPGSPSSRKERHPPPNHMYGCGRSDGPPRAARRQSRPFQEAGSLAEGGREGDALAPAGRGAGGAGGAETLTADSGFDLSWRAVGLPGSLPERCLERKEPCPSRRGWDPASRPAQGSADVGRLPSGPRRVGVGRDRHKASCSGELSLSSSWTWHFVPAAFPSWFQTQVPKSEFRCLKGEEGRSVVTTSLPIWGTAGDTRLFCPKPSPSWVSLGSLEDESFHWGAAFGLWQFVSCCVDGGGGFTSEENPGDAVRTDIKKSGAKRSQAPT